MSANPIHLVKRYLCVKKLTINDGFTNKSVKLPRAEARFFMGELRNRQAIPLVLLDEGGSCWELVCTCSGAQYSLSRIGAFCEAHGARPGCYFIFYADHEHIVRLAVRQQLPEDVQAALAAARAAVMAVRFPPQSAAMQSQQQQQAKPAAATASNSPVSLPPDSAGQSVLDDPVALDEMPPATCNRIEEVLARGPAPAVAAVLAPPKEVVGAEMPRVKPLQDRSNLPAGQPLPDATTSGARPKVAGEGKSGYLAAGALGATSRVSVDDKENDLSALQAAPAGKPPSSASTFLVVSSAGLQAPAPAPGNSRVLLQQQQPAPPPPSSLLLSRSPPAPPSPPPATRLRMRFEARVRAQAGKLHPLSVRTGPESPLPVPPGCCGASMWSAAAHPGAYPLEGTANYVRSHSSSLVPRPWGSTGVWGYPAPGFGPDSPAVGPVGPCPPPSGHRRVASSLHPAVSGAPQPWQQQEHQQGDIAADMSSSKPDHLEPCDDLQCRDLNCDELLEWDLGRRGASSSIDAGGWYKSWSFAAPGQPSCPRYSAQTQPPMLALPSPRPQRDARPAVPTAMSHPRMNMSLLRQLLLLQGGQQSPLRGNSGPPAIPLYTGQEPHTSYSSMMRHQQRAADLQGVHEPLPNRQSQPQLPSPRNGGGPFPFASATSALRQLLSMSGAWDFTAMSGAAGQLGQLGGASAHSPLNTMRVPVSNNTGVVAADSPFQHPHQHVAMLGRSSPLLPSYTHHQVPGATHMDVDCLTGSREEQPAGHAGSLGARPKTSLSIGRELERDIPGLPDQSPNCKRQRSEVPRQLLARKVLTAHDLLTDRVTLLVTPAACAMLVSHLGGDEVAVDGAQADHRSKAKWGPRNSGDMLVAIAFTPELGRQQRQQCQGLTLLGWPTSVSVDVLVESGARYKGLLVPPEPSGSVLPREWELRGLRPYLIRRQAGVGDVLTLGIDDTNWHADSCLRLVAQLQQCKAV
ncbi:hypothetical protein Vretimale_17518 [Volvox reticuliferus]|uniref:Uncharacterized protein n=1 Tax=Volvox reticuliferus TaxID=1737510 RepID=A0A8J4GTA5_9CHLO|nr:hypothetical protein Vretifemale_18190 [Volvox reticuliferus]GIM14586.1 hypothetical protein Vretimale_17518 [Volvox reticuliferus]